jgi:meso-butanediol dehydrogenase/(S,S)-butanediol dehydrogenase/diacetyl reductase
MAIENKVALVTGAGQGIGRGIALRLAKDGASVMLVDVNPEGIAAVAAEVEALGRKAATFVANIADRAQVYAAIDEAEKQLGGFDIIVNNAGIAQVQALADVMPEEVDRIMRINVQGTLWGIQAAAKNSSIVSRKGKSSTPALSPVMMVSRCLASIPPPNLPYAP